MKKIILQLILLIVAIAAPTVEILALDKPDIHITGHILNSKTNEHIPFATITIKGTTVGVVADATGHFMLTAVEPGTYTIEADCTGFSTQEKQVTISENQKLSLNFELDVKILEVDDVVITGSRTEISRKKSSVVVNVVNDQLFEKTSSNNVAEVLNFQPGLRVEYNCSNCGVSQLRINGLEGQYSQILLDSRPIFSSLAGVYGLEQLPSAMIERIEVIRGGGSALFGSSAIGGVVNIITKDPKSSLGILSNTTSVNDKGGMDINTSMNAAIVSDDTRSGIYLFSMLRNRDMYDRNDDGFTEIPELNLQTVGFRAYHRPTDRSRISAEFHHINDYRRGGNMLDVPAHDADVAEQLRHNINGGGLKYDYYSSNMRHRFALYTSLQTIDRESYFGMEQDPNAYGTTDDITFNGGGQYIYDMKDCIFMPAKLTTGLEYESNKLTDKMPSYNRNIDQSTNTYGVFVQNEWQSDKFSLLLGGRLDKHNMIENAIFSPRANVRYTPSDLLGLRLSYSSGYRAPKAYDEDLHIAAVGGEITFIEINPDLRPEYSHTFSGSTDFYKKIGSVETNLLLEGFYTELSDVFALTEKGLNSDGIMILERVNESGAVVKGVNMELKVGFSPKVILEGGFTLQDSRYKEDFTWSSNEDLAPQRKMFRAPDTYGYFSLNYNPTSKFSTTLSTNYTGSMLVQHVGDDDTRFDSELTTSSFWDSSFLASYKFRVADQLNMQVSAGVKNMFDAYQSDLDSGINRDPGYIYGPINPRTYHLSLKFTLQ